jgi:DNA-binding LytR/AlgR family response regulator
VDYKKRVIRQRDIRYVEIFNKKSAIHLADETVTTYINITEMEELLTLPSFLRCHRCNIVNMDYIDGGAEDERDFIMENGDRVYIGRNDRYKAKRAYREYIARLARGQPTTAAGGG